MCVGHVEPGQRKGARQHLAVVDRHGDQLAVELVGEIAADFLDRLFDDEMVVEQPLGGRRDGGAGFHIARGLAVDAEDFLLVFLVPRLELEGQEGRQRGPAFARELRAALGKILVRKIGRANGIVVVDLLGVEIARLCCLGSGWRHEGCLGPVLGNARNASSE